MDSWNKGRNSSSQNQLTTTGTLFDFAGRHNVTIGDERRGNIGILSIKGSFAGRPGVSFFERALFGLLKDDIIHIILDLGELKYIDSAGLGAMISAMVSVGRKDGALKLAAVRGDIQRIVHSMHLDQVFELYDTVDQAEASFGKRGRT